MNTFKVLAPTIATLILASAIQIANAQTTPNSGEEKSTKSPPTTDGSNLKREPKGQANRDSSSKRPTSPDSEEKSSKSPPTNTDGSKTSDLSRDPNTQMKRDPSKKSPTSPNSEEKSSKTPPTKN